MLESVFNCAALSLSLSACFEQQKGFFASLIEIYVYANRMWPNNGTQIRRVALTAVIYFNSDRKI